MNPLVTLALSFALVLGLLEILEGAFYNNTIIKIPKNIVIERFSGVTKPSCVHRCRLNFSCHQAAMQGSNCLFLRDGVDQTNDDDDLMEVVLLAKIRKLVG